MREIVSNVENMPKVTEKEKRDDEKSKDEENHQRIMQVHITELKVIKS